MKRIRLAAATLMAVAFLGVIGCGSGENYVPVSGRVTLDGQPYDDAVVVFQPMSNGTNISPGQGSSGYTIRDGKFTLKCIDGIRMGAVVGKHQVRIMTKGNVGGYDPANGSPDGDIKNPARPNSNLVPGDWVKEFDVPPGGTDKANFDIVTPVKKTGKK